MIKNEKGEQRKVKEISNKLKKENRGWREEEGTNMMIEGRSLRNRGGRREE